MRYVFVDIDELIGYDEKSEEEAISKNVLKMLKKIIQKTSCRLVITSKWRREFWTEKYDLLSPHVRNVVDSMAKYNIDVFSITPSKEDVPNYSKQDSIISWLSKSYVDNDKFVIGSAEVKVGADPLTEAKTYKIYVQATDSKGKTFKEGFDIPVAEA